MKLSIHDEPLKVLTLHGPDHKKEHDWLMANEEPTYRDTIMKEHLFSVNLVDEKEDDEQYLIPPFVREFVELIQKKYPNVAYFRFAY